MEDAASCRARRRRRPLDESWPGAKSSLHLLTLLLMLASCLAEARRTDRVAQFAFTAPLYNFSFVENGARLARSDDMAQVGVPMLDSCDKVEFRITGPNKKKFEAAPVRIGNFVFLRLTQKPTDAPLNREHESEYSFTVKALCSLRNKSRLEDQTKLRVVVRDANEQSPWPVMDEHRAVIDSMSAPFTSVYCMEASDADAGLNSDVLFSLVNRSADFYIEPTTGCIRTLRSPIRYNSTVTLRVRLEDRASRLFYYDDKTRTPETFADVQITVVHRRRDRLNVLVERRPVDTSEEATAEPQLAAVIRVEDDDKEAKHEVVLMDEHDSGRLFELKRESSWTPSSSAPSSEGAWLLWTRADARISSGASVRIRAGTDHSPDRNTTAEIVVETVERHNISFARPRYELVVSEAAIPGETVGVVAAEPLRREDVSAVSYSIEQLSGGSEGGDFPFSIDEDSGRIRLAKRLDYRETTEYTFNVLTKLRGHGHQTSTTVLVHVLDANNHSPDFAVKWTIHAPIPIPKDAKPGAKLLQISALDRDFGENGRISYKIIPLSSSSIPLAIDADSGEITLASPMPSNQSSWQVGVVAVDWGRPLARAAQVNLVFFRNGTKVPKQPETRAPKQPANEHSPVLLEEEKAFEVDEDADISTVVGIIPVKDDDAGFGGIVRLATWDKYFEVDAESGELRVARQLTQFLKPGQKEVLHELEVTAQDLGQPSKSSKRKYAIRVKDVNNHAPVFEKPFYRIRVMENSGAGVVLLKVIATDEDGGDNGRVRYELSGGPTGANGKGEEHADEKSPISIDRESGEVQLERPLDREHAETLRFTIAAFDGGQPSRVSFANLTIDVDDANDNNPHCVEQEVTARISEEWPDGALVGCVAAHDGDSDENGRLQFSLVAGEYEGEAEIVPFRIDSHSGCVFIRTEQPLDFEKRSIYNLSIEVSDNGESSLSTVCRMVVQLTDVDENRNPPVFDAIALEASVFENEPIGTPVINLIVRDADGGEAENVTLEIVGGDGRGFFTIIGTDIRTAAVLDREVKAAYWLTVRASDAAPTPLSSHVFVYVRINDRSDHSPMFKLPFYEAHVLENSPPGTVVVKVEADDGDWPPSGRPPIFRYTIEKGDPQSFFVIDENTGYIATGGARKLDREMQRTFELEVRALNTGERELNTATVRVVVVVDDENDNSPSFVHPNRQFSVAAKKKKHLCRVLVKDDDAGENATLTFNITSLESNRFVIDNHGRISAREPMTDGEVVTLDVRVSDNGNPSRATTTRIVLNASNQTRNKEGPNRKPIFASKDEYRYAVSDADVVGNPVGMLSASDPDDDILWWSLIEEDIDNSSEPLHSAFFALAAESGALVLAKPIERLPDGVGQIELRARVTDGRESADTKVILDLSRSLTRRPVFSSSEYVISVSEKTPIGTSLLVAAASSGYGNDMKARPIEYGISQAESEAAASAVGIDPSTGVVMLIGSLDYESARNLRLVLEAKQAGGLSGYAMLTVEVMDENDNAPLFTPHEYHVLLDKITPAGSLLTTVTAFDADIGENGVIAYSIVSGNELGLFSLDAQTGEITSAVDLSPQQHALSILTVRAADRAGAPGALSSVAVVRIDSVTRRGSASSGDEKQKNPPAFARAVYHRMVRANTPVGTLLLVVSASSAATDGQLLRYELREKCTWIIVHPISGAIRLKRWLTKVRTRSVNCTVTAVGSDGMEATTKVVLKVIDTNEHPPVFRQQVYRGFIRENGTAGAAVVAESDASTFTSTPLTLSATDRDSGPNALVGYRILGDDPYFTVDYMSGAVTARRPLDFEKLHEWRFHVVARDMGRPVMTSPLAALVVVNVMDVNDCAPRFTSSEYTADLILPTVPGVRLLTLEAKDEDTVGELRYRLRRQQENDSSTSLFRVDAVSGELIVFGESRNFTERLYKLDVFVSDGLHTASTVVRVHVRRPTSDFRFAQSVYTATVPENVSPEKPIPIVTVVVLHTGSASSSAASPVSYSLLGGRDDFALSAATGQLSFIGPQALDREKEQHILLVVQARSHSSSPSASRVVQCIVRVSVLDENDNPPVILRLPLHVAVPKGTKKGAKLLTIRATDADAGINGTVSFSSSDLPSQLTISSKDSAILAAEDLNEETNFHFNLVASDGGSPSLKTDTVVRVEVVDAARPRFKQRTYTTKVTTSRSRKQSLNLARVEAVSDAKDARVLYSIEHGDDERLFEIDLDTGELSVATSALEEAFERRTAEMTEDEKERNAIHFYNLTIQARDATRPHLSDTAHAVVEVTTGDRRRLRFVNSTYQIRVSEQTPSGTEIGRVTVVGGEGREREEDGQVIYSLHGVNATVFSLDASTGSLSLAAPLDFETQPVYTLHAAATRDAALEQPAKSLVVVEVVDANDESPHFVQPFAAATILDSAKPGDFVTIMSVVDMDTVASLPDGARLLYSVIDGDDTLLSVDKNSGVVRLGREIEDEDLEERAKTLNISVSDGIFTAFGRLQVSLGISSARSPPPRFEQSQYVVTVKESPTRSSTHPLLTLHASEGVAPLSFSLGGSNGGGVAKKGAASSPTWPISVESTSGKVHLKRVLNYRDGHVFVIPLIVSDALGRRAFSTLTLRVTDENDSTPEFPVKEYSASVSAAAKPGEAVIQVSAVDSDEADHIEYALSGDSHGLRIDERIGVVSVGPEATLAGIAGRTLQLVVRATDAGNPPHSTSAFLAVSVAPPDVALPRFANSLYRFNVPEDVEVGFLIGGIQQTATDVGDVRYELVSTMESLPFSIDRNGKLHVQALLDRELISLWRFVVVARAAGGAHASATVVVEVEDVNDNAPLFRGSYEHLSVGEDAEIGTSIAVFSATDEDYATNAKITFSLLDSEASSDIHLDPNSGWLTVAKTLDRERKSKYQLTARATDEGGKSSDLPFTIKIVDANDSPPVFDETNYTIRINPSSLVPGQTIARVLITDADLPPHNQTRLFIGAGNEDGFFAVDDQGRITLASHRSPQSLISAGTRSYELLLLAHDGVHTSRATVTIHSTPTARASVECPSKRKVIKVLENTKEGTVLPELEPLAPGSTGSAIPNMIYSLLPSSSDISPDTSGLPFAVDVKSGVLRVSGALDRERRGRFALTRHAEAARDATTPFECDEDILILLLDENDNPPEFEKKEYAVTVKENEAATETERVFVARVAAHDSDAGAFGRVQYSMAPDAQLSAFRLDEETGVLSLVAALDREKQAKYKITVVATDGDEKQPKSAQATVIVSVADQNDNAPAFERQEYTISVLENEAVGYTLLKLKADGGDEGEMVRFELVEGHADNRFVTINKQTGELRLSKVLDYEKQQRLAVRVRAVDSGDPPLSAEAAVSIEVLDVNDNIPSFIGSPYKVVISESAKKGSQVAKVIAKDADSGVFGRVFYSLKEVDGEGMPFAVDADSGVVTLKTALDYEKTKHYRIQVLARDGGTPPMNSTGILDLEVSDENDNAPLFAVCNLSIVVQENVAAGHTVMQLAVTDADSPKYGGPPFNISIHGEGADAFTVDSTLAVMTTPLLAAIRRDNFTLMIRAVDAGGRHSDCPLTVLLRAESRHAPRIRPLKAQLFTLLGEYAGGIVGWMDASDPDADDLLRFSIIEQSVTAPSNSASPHNFHIDQESGVVIAGPGIAPGIHTFNVSVSDGKFFTYASATVEVSDISETVAEHTMIVRLPEVASISHFFTEHLEQFKADMGEILNIKPNLIKIVSVVEIDRERPRRERRRVRQGSTENNESAASGRRRSGVDVAFVAERPAGRGFIAPRQFYARMTRGDNVLLAKTRARYLVLPDPCATRTRCSSGCKDEVVFDESDWLRYKIAGRNDEETESFSFAAPVFERRANCECPRGRGGVSCQNEADGCARSHCTKEQMCIPIENRPGGRIECVCPPGLSGERCNMAEECGQNSTDCRERAALHIHGVGFASVDLPVSVEARLDLSFEFRTTTRDGVLMHAAGDGGDFHSFEISGGTLAYRWDAGMGVQNVASSTEVADGSWHTVWVKRVGRQVTMMVDQGAKIIAEAPAGADVVNLWRHRKTVIFGGLVSFDSLDHSMYSLSRPVAACIRGLKLDQMALPLTSTGLRLHGGARPGCGPLPASVCFAPDGGAEGACVNGAKCVADSAGYRCECASDRYRGARCEVDTDPCGMTYPPKSCPIGECIPFDADYTCKCPQGFTGKHCDGRDSNINWSMERTICDREPAICGVQGKCVYLVTDQHNIGSNYICNCSGTYKNISCDDEGAVASFLASYGREILVGILTLFVLSIIVALVYFFCRWRNERDDKVAYGDHVYSPHGLNPNLLAANATSTTTSSLLQQHHHPAPPLPPRTFRNGRPTIEVRPYAAEERLSSSRGDSGSPSLAGSFSKRGSMTGAGYRGSFVAANHSTSCADYEASCGDSSARRDLEALRRIGLPLPDDGPPLHPRRARGRDAVSGASGRHHRTNGDALTEERLPLGDSWPPSGARDPIDRISRVIEQEQERRKLRAGGAGQKGAGGRVWAGETILSPVQNDDDYMTMRPRQPAGSSASSAESQKKPLLEGEEDDEDDNGCHEGPLSEPPPVPPPHKAPNAVADDDYDSTSAWQSRLYDDPVESSIYRSDDTSAVINDIDATDDEESAPPLASASS